MKLNNKIIDWWSIPHFLRGFIVGTFVNRNVAYSIFVAAEIIENTLLREMQIFKEGPINIVSDIAFDIFGYEVAKKISKKI